MVDDLKTIIELYRGAAVTVFLAGVVVGGFLWSLG